MSWALEADVEYAGEPSSLIKPFVDFYDEDIKEVRIIVKRGDYPSDEIANFVIDVNEVLSTRLIMEINKYFADDIKITIECYLKVHEPRYTPVPELTIRGFGLGKNCIRRRAPVVVGFGNRNAWNGDSTLENSGRKIDESLVASFLKHFCMKIKPKSLYLINEEQASIPFNDHFVYHSHISGFVDDLYDIIKLCLYGGSGYYNDGRARYEAVLYEEKTMLLCSRRGEYREKFKQFLKAKLPILESNVSINISKDMVENALLKYNDIMDFFIDSDGMGIYSKPLLDKYIEMFYISLIDDLAGGNDLTQNEFIS